MSDLYRDFIDQKADQIINSLGGTITPAPANAELYRDFLNRKFDDVINAIDNVKVKSFTYTGTGTSNNTITFPTDWKILLFVEGMGTNSNNVALSNPIINGVSPYIQTHYFRPSSVNVIYTNDITDMTSRTLTFTMPNSGVALNTIDEPFTVLYI